MRQKRSFERPEVKYFRFFGTSAIFLLLIYLSNTLAMSLRFWGSSVDLILLFTTTFVLFSEERLEFVLFPLAFWVDLLNLKPQGYSGVLYLSLLIILYSLKRLEAIFEQDFSLLLLVLSVVTFLKYMFSFLINSIFLPEKQSILFTSLGKELIINLIFAVPLYLFWKFFLSILFNPTGTKKGGSQL